MILIKKKPLNKLRPRKPTAVFFFFPGEPPQTPGSLGDVGMASGLDLRS